MDKKKSFTIVTIFSIMFAIVLWFSYKAMPIAYNIIITILSAYGFLRGLIDFETWLRINPSKNNSYNGTAVHIINKKENETIEENYEISDIIDEFK